MQKINRVFLYKIIALLCLIILCTIQLLHIINFYKLQNEIYDTEGKKSIKAQYEKSIVNDKIYPGAQNIVDGIIYRNYDLLQHLSKVNTGQFNLLAHKLCDTMFKQLAMHNNMDSIFKKIKEKNSIKEDMEYALLIEHLDIAFLPNQYFNIFDKANNKNFSGAAVINNQGIRIGGNLSSLNEQNLITAITVSSPEGRSYKISFALFSDTPHRLQQVIVRMLPQTLLSIFSIISILLIFLFTFANWIKQKKLSEMKSDFINTITHEFQTPLTAIIIANKTIENENNMLVNKKIASLNGVIKRQTERLNILIKQVAETSGEKAIILNLVPCNVNEFLDEILSDYQLNILNSDVKAILIKETNNDSVLLDKLHFTSIILNVINNAIKYNHKQKKEIIITSSITIAGMLTITIKDNGEGMSDKVIKNMFDKFYRNPSLTTSNEPGLGLGLYYSKQCLDAHNWKYEVKSEESKGTEFIIYIPLQNEYKEVVLKKNYLYKT